MPASGSAGTPTPRPTCPVTWSTGHRGSTAYELLTDFPLNATTFLDPDLTLNTVYKYRITAVDSSGNESDHAGEPARTAVGAGTYRADNAGVRLDGDWTADVDAAAPTSDSRPPGRVTPA